MATRRASEVLWVMPSSSLTAQYSMITVQPNPLKREKPHCRAATAKEQEKAAADVASQHRKRDFCRSGRDRSNGAGFPL